MNQQEFELFCLYIREVAGIDYFGKNEVTLKTAVKERMRATGVSAAITYLNRIKTDKDEYREFLDLVTTPETYFFRDNEQFEFLKNNLLPQIRDSKLQLPSPPPIRILSCGCSTGEEVYSIAMAVKEAMLIRDYHVDIVGFDINEKNIEKAKMGVYPKYSFRGVSNEVIKRYFEVKGLKHHVLPEIKEMVTFYTLSIFKINSSPFLSRAYDIIFFRNVSIYFEYADVVTIINNLERKIVPGGYLFLGHTESLMNIDTGFAKSPCRGVYKYSPGRPLSDRTHHLTHELSRMSASKLPMVRPGDNPVTRPISFLPTRPLPPGWTIPGKVRQTSSWSAPGNGSSKTTTTAAVANSGRRSPAGSPEECYQKAVELFESKRFAEAESMLKTSLTHCPKDTRFHLVLARIYADSNKLDEAAERCRQIIGIDDLQAAAYFLLGLINLSRNRWDEALANFRRTVYCQPEHFTAQYHLGLTLIEKGDLESGCRELKTTIKMIEAMEQDCLTRVIEDYSGEQVIRLCRDLLDKHHLPRPE
ncbi:MAG: tetratricopeptide repeat protein [Deltaproteobacteria bacterium]|nr:tetratricopeptide repeat protein [Deltaproteobacteria bacterium]